MSQSLRAPEKAWTKCRGKIGARFWDIMGKIGARSSQNRLPLLETSLSTIILEFGLLMSMFVSTFLLSWGLSNPFSYDSPNQGLGLAIVCVTIPKRMAKENLVHKLFNPIVIFLLFAWINSLNSTAACPLLEMLKVRESFIRLPLPTPAERFQKPTSEPRCTGASLSTFGTHSHLTFSLHHMQKVS